MFNKTWVYVLCGLFVSMSLYAKMESSPFEYWGLSFDKKAIMVTVIAIDDDINIPCNAINNKMGHGNFKQLLSGCAFWTNEDKDPKCIILVNKFTNNDIIGHEFRHCLEKDFHK